MTTPDELVERVARLYEDKWGVSDYGLARAAIAVALEQAAKVGEHRAQEISKKQAVAYHNGCDREGERYHAAQCKALEYSAAIRALIGQNPTRTS